MEYNVRKKIVIVDDNAANLSIVRNLLKPYYEVYPAPSAIKLFTIMGNLIPDLVLLDVDMPGMSGYEAIKTMKATPRLKDIPVVFLTAKDDEASELVGFDLGAADYVTKPFYGPLLLRRISNLLLIEQLKRELQESQVALKELRDKVGNTDPRRAGVGSLDFESQRDGSPGFGSLGFGNLGDGNKDE